MNYIIILFVLLALLLLNLILTSSNSNKECCYIMLTPNCMKLNLTIKVVSFRGKARSINGAFM